MFQSCRLRLKKDSTEAPTLHPAQFHSTKTSAEDIDFLTDLTDSKQQVKQFAVDRHQHIATICLSKQYRRLPKAR